MYHVSDSYLLAGVMQKDDDDGDREQPELKARGGMG